MLGLMAAANGIEAITTLTGFKWVARPIVERPESHYLLGYEEAIGYCVGGRVRDKDGVSAALVAAEMVAGLRAAGTTVWDRLDALAIEHGVHETGPVTIRFDGADGTETRSRLMQRITDEPPAALGGHELTSREDLSEGRRFPPTTGVELHYGEVRVIVRPSGTEPKLKAYVEVRNPVAAGDLTSARTEAESTLALVQDELRGFFERV
jgi:phosphomannomutase